MNHRYLCLRCSHMWEQEPRAGMTADPLCPDYSGQSANFSSAEEKHYEESSRR
jgi:hypothetical protein